MQIEKFQELYQLEYTVISVSFFIIGTCSKSVQGDIQFQFYLLQYMVPNYNKSLRWFKL